MLTTLWLLFLTLLSAGLEIILFLYLMGQKIRLRYFFLLLIFNLAFNFIYNHSSWFIIKFWGEDIYYLLLSFLLSTKTKKPLKIKIFNGLFPHLDSLCHICGEDLGQIEISTEATGVRPILLRQLP